MAIAAFHVAGQELDATGELDQGAIAYTVQLLNENAERCNGTIPVRFSYSAAALWASAMAVLGELDAALNGAEAALHLGVEYDQPQWATDMSMLTAQIHEHMGDAEAAATAEAHAASFAN